MLRFRIPDIVLGAILGVATLGLAIFAMGFVLGSSQYSSQSTQNQSPGKTSDPDSKNEQQEGFWQGATTDPVAVFTLCLVFVGVFQAGLFYVQLKLIRKSLVDAEKAANAATVGAAAAKQSADATIATLHHMRDTAERQLRAYVIIDGAAIMNIASGQTPKAVIDFKNFGQTPAYNVTHWQVITKPQIFRQSDDPFRLPPADLYRSIAIIGPTSGMKMLSTAKRPLTEEEFTGLADGTLAMYVFGEIRYRDAFGEDRFMRYRRMLGGHTGVEGNRLAATQYPDEAN